MTDFVGDYCHTPSPNAPKCWVCDGLLGACKCVDAASTRTQGADARPVAKTTYVACHECVECGHIGINDDHPTDAACGHPCGWSGPSPTEDKCPACARENVMIGACPKCSGRYSIIAEAMIATRDAAPTDAQDAERYRWLSDRFIGCDFDWMPSAENAGDGKSVLCFEIGRDCRVWGDAGMTIDAAIAATQRDKS